MGEEKMRKGEHQGNNMGDNEEYTADNAADQNAEALKAKAAADFDAKAKKAADEIFDAVEKEKNSRKAKSKLANVTELEYNKLVEELAEARDRSLRTLAELENFRNRKNREMAEDQKYASMALARDILPVWDNLGRALESAPQDENVQGFVDGVRMVYQQFVDVLRKHDIERISAEGEQFNPNFHESISMLPSDKPAGTVLIDTKAGFKLHDRVVRPAQVVVAAPNPTPKAE